MKKLVSVFDGLLETQTDKEKRLYAEEIRTWPDAQVRLGVFAGNNMLSDFITTLKQGADIQENKKLLVTTIASAGVDVAVWMADHAQEYGINLDHQDNYYWKNDILSAKDPERKAYFEWVASVIDVEDRLGWIKGDYLRNTALLLAVKKGWDHLDMQGYCTTKMGAAISALLKAKANPDATDACGNTALHIAVMKREIPTIKALRDHGAKRDIRNNAGLLAEDMLDVPYNDINPFLYQQCGNDTNCYIHTLQDKSSWLRSHDAVAALIRNNDSPRFPSPAL